MRRLEERFAGKKLTPEIRAQMDEVFLRFAYAALPPGFDVEVIKDNDLTSFKTRLIFPRKK